MSDNDKPTIDTILAQVAHFIDPGTGAVVPPIQLSTTFARDENYELIGKYIYGRYQSPTYEPVEQLIAELEGAAEASIFASGQAAAASVFETVRPGKQILAPTVMYHGLQELLRHIAERRGIAVTFYDAKDLAALERAIVPGQADLVWIETLLNPTWDVIDVAGSARIAHKAGAVLAVDATVTPALTLRAIDHGADYVFHSTTKYLNGHSDVTGGVLACRQAEARWQEMKHVRKMVGGIMGPFEAWLLLRGMRTLAVRYDKAAANAMKIARHFEGHRAVERVIYAGLESHPGHALAKRQMRRGFGGMLSICVKGGAAEAKLVATRARKFIAATSLGGVESLLEHRASVEGPHSTVAKNLLRVSVGIEDPDDLIADLEQALAPIAR
ncbi:MAG: PLP-dependent aspartate aminotransferase family protein [Reyranellaceae bacterium]